MRDSECSGEGDCQPLIERLTQELYSEPQACTVVIRLDHDTFTILGHQVICGRYNSATAEEALETAVEDTGWGGRMLNAEDPEETYVFFTPAGDFGGASAVSANTGLSVFGGSTVWSGSGDITYPLEWRAPAEIGRTCTSTREVPYAVGYDLVGGVSMDEEMMQTALDTVKRTVVIDAMAAGGSIFSATVLRYPRTVGVVNPTNSEWIVLLNGGWLD